MRRRGAFNAFPLERSRPLCSRAGRAQCCQSGHSCHRSMESSCRHQHCGLRASPAPVESRVPVPIPPHHLGVSGSTYMGLGRMLSKGLG